MRTSLLLLLSFLLACQSSEENKKITASTVKASKWKPLQHPEWSKNLSIYEVNIRQYTPEGTFKAFEKHLPRIKELGTDILWLMPIHPIGENNRKGSLGSYYSVKDYRGVNPDFGTEDDFRHLVDEAHKLGMYVLLDWVANHTAWDNPLVEQHPEWYEKDHNGDFQPPKGTDWTDVIILDYKQEELRQYMIESLKYWVREFDIDGYRCDVAGFVPTDFWNDARMALDEIKPVFMLAEWHSRDLHKHAFDMTYGWNINTYMHELWKGNKNAAALSYAFAEHLNSYDPDAYEMLFVENHDKNSWEGTATEQFGDGLKAFIVITCTAKGMPLVYSGQEAGNNRRLSFFEKDEIEWKDDPMFSFYKKLLSLRKGNPALWNGKAGGTMLHVHSDNETNVFAYVRRKSADNQVLVTTNLSNENQLVTLKGNLANGRYQELFSGEAQEIKTGHQLSLEPWGYRVYTMSETMK